MLHARVAPATAQFDEAQRGLEVAGEMEKVERIGEMNYPQAARDQKLYGSLVVTVYIRADGSMEKAEVNRPSGQRVLDEALDLARRTIEFTQFLAKHDLDPRAKPCGAVTVHDSCHMLRMLGDDTSARAALDRLKASGKT